MSTMEYLALVLGSKKPFPADKGLLANLVASGRVLLALSFCGFQKIVHRVSRARSKSASSIVLILVD